MQILLIQSFYRNSNTLPGLTADQNLSCFIAFQLILRFTE